jgi:pyruvate dehydrogenase E1 component beta subunit
MRLTGPDAPAPSSWVLEQAGIPQPQAIVQAAVQMCAGAPLDAVPA